MEPSDKILILLKQGDKCGLELLFRQFYRPLVMYAMRFVDHQEEAEDVVQEVFIKLWESNRFEDIKRYLRSYLYQSVRNRCLNLLESTNGYRTEISDSLFLFSDSDMPDESEWDARMDEVYHEIDMLPARTREVFMAVVIDGKHYKEVATELDISVNTVKTMLARAMATLRANLSDGACALLFLYL